MLGGHSACLVIGIPDAAQKEKAVIPGECQIPVSLEKDGLSILRLAMAPSFIAVIA